MDGERYVSLLRQTVVCFWAACINSKKNLESPPLRIVGKRS